MIVCRAGSRIPARRWARGLYSRDMPDSEVVERITARRAELDVLEEQLAKQLVEVRVERDELAVAERVFTRLGEQVAQERAAAVPASAQVGGQAVLLIPHRVAGMNESARPSEYQRILAAVRRDDGPVATRQVGDVPERTTCHSHPSPAGAARRDR